VLSQNLRKATISFVVVRLSACLPACLCSNWTELIIFDIPEFFENLSRKFKFHFNLTRITGTLHDVKVIFIVISRSILLVVRNVSDERCIENQNTNFMLNKVFFKKSYVFF